MIDNPLHDLPLNDLSPNDLSSNDALSNDRPLINRPAINMPHIIVTRPAPEGEALTYLLNQAGLVAQHLPLFAIAAGKDLANLSAELNALAPNDMVMIVSPQVSHQLSAYRPAIHFPTHLHYFAVGKKSAKLFADMAGVPVAYPPQENSEGLITLIQDSLTISDKKVLILRSESGRELLGDTLTHAHASVKYIQCYTRTPITYHADQLAANINSTNPLMIIITSHTHLLQLDTFCPPLYKQYAQLLATSPRILDEAKQLGWQHCHLVNGANNKILVKTITTLCHNEL
ncbi:uroporphyrinogen-III synthase [Orbaceae bacterium ESL0727]|nr:uroporphyrinogen-III synthase [Orbaceae bacterium ESL0727]